MTKKLFLTLPLLMSIILHTGCKSKYTQDPAGFASLQQDIIEKFGADAYYTAISMSAAGGEHQGYAIIVDVTKEQDEIRQERWVRTGGAWQQEGYANMQIDMQSPSFYKFQLGKEISLSTLGTLIVDAKDRFVKEQKGTDPYLRLAIVNTNNMVKDTNRRYQYTIILSQKGTDDTHSYNYDIKGILLQSN